MTLNSKIGKRKLEWLEMSITNPVKVTMNRLLIYSSNGVRIATPSLHCYFNQIKNAHSLTFFIFICIFNMLTKHLIILQAKVKLFTFCFF